MFLKDIFLITGSGYLVNTVLKKLWLKIKKIEIKM